MTAQWSPHPRHTLHVLAPPMWVNSSAANVKGGMMDKGTVGALLVFLVMLLYWLMTEKWGKGK